MTVLARLGNVLFWAGALLAAVMVFGVLTASNDSPISVKLAAAGLYGAIFFLPAWTLRYILRG